MVTSHHGGRVVCRMRRRLSIQVLATNSRLWKLKQKKRKESRVIKCNKKFGKNLMGLKKFIKIVEITSDKQNRSIFIFKLSLITPGVLVHVV